MVYKFPQLSREEIYQMLKIATEARQTRFYQEAREEGLQEGRKEGERSLILRLLQRRLGELPTSARARIEGLSLEQLEALGEALLDFEVLADLEGWLRRIS
ncbi:DUF4351 domain-containing protein [Trichothermofontia sichuanensis B231]|uniref:DUF4351 domain-containing protein n=1 Tax=Trichothermofontia sichuanensis TaxID=3045816 RepID=UPI0022486C75|nr:DUF4351 domain-containing protein [Trichothermofontia sichuanensis]UZQ54128.1 DUF4351 domain-containing protein [Trichothermofontia sichuanensis B231]